MIYSIFCSLDGKTIATIHGECADDAAAIEKARWHLRSSAADTARVHRDAPLYPLGEMIAELKADDAQGSEPGNPFEAYFYSQTDWAEMTINAARPSWHCSALARSKVRKPKPSSSRATTAGLVWSTSKSAQPTAKPSPSGSTKIYAFALPRMICLRR
jgi:hypothetical protein